MNMIESVEKPSNGGLLAFSNETNQEKIYDLTNR
jgi:hypothetical protein